MGSRRRLSRPCEPLLLGACARGNGAWQHTLLATNMIRMRLLGRPLTRDCFECRRTSDITCCNAEGCGVRAGFGYPGRKPERCKAHVLDGMVRITSHTVSTQALHSAVYVS